ncbi:MAG: hypothetical protein GY866_31445, partial [Proteobacteria bacterium]|nr:hypothetical protein [Pseudomonadota bacterium]
MDRRIFRHQFLLPLAVSVVVILLVFSGCAPAPGKVTAPKAPTSPLIAGVAMQISDIHFNPLYDETIFKKLQAAEPEAWEDIFAISSKKGVGAYHNFPEETYYPLLLSAFKNMAAVSKKPDFILFTGDFLAHTFPKRYKTANGGSQGFHSFVDKTLAFCAFMFNKYMPGVPVYFTLGNNDTYSGDYRIVPEGEFLKKTAQIFSQSLFRNPANRELFSKTFPIGGYYSIVPPTGAGTRIISLNSNFFSTHYETSFTRYNPGDRELDWLEAQLKSARENKEKVWILQHIPNGPSIYSYVTKKTYDPQWSAKYNSRYIELLTAYSDIVNAGFAGHTHMDSYRLLMGGQPALPLAFINISPAVSALFGNNPGFKRITYKPVGFSLV